MNLLEVKDLRVYFGESPNEAHAVDGVSFSLSPGESLGIIGESGSGKSMTALSIMRLLPPNARLASGTILFNGRNLLELPEEEMRKLRGFKISMIFQDPVSSLNPVISVGEQIREMVQYHRPDIHAREQKAFVLSLLEKMKIKNPERCYDSFPHELSGGMAQRMIIATMALVSKPEILIADEPTTALDVTVQAQILDQLTLLLKELGIALIFITHNLGLVAEYVDRVLVMKEGRIVEQGSVFQIFENPTHPYTRHLLEVVPKIQLQEGGKSP